MMNYEPSYSKCYKRKARPINEDDDGGGLDDGAEARAAQFMSSQPFKTAKEKLLLDTDKKNPQPYYQPQMKQQNIYQPPAPAQPMYQLPPPPPPPVPPQYQQYQPPAPAPVQQAPPQMPAMMNRPLYSSNVNNNNNTYSDGAPARRGGVYAKYNLPTRQNSGGGGGSGGGLGGGGGGLRGPSSGRCCNCNRQGNASEEFPNLKNIDPKLIEIITNEVMDRTPPITWDDIAGLSFVKRTLQEIVVWPMLRPDIFKGLRGPPKGLLLFGPPGTGKTLIAKCIAHESQSTFFNISSSTLTSKWQGESEKLVKVLFEVARQCQPAVIFIDEIDSLLAKRSDDDRESSRRIKTEFFVQMDGAGTSADERILLIAATNRPQELDDAARRRFVKRLYIPLPEKEGRRQIIESLMAKQGNELDEAELEDIAERTDGYSGADMTNLCREAALGPIRSLDTSTLSITTIDVDQIRPILHHDFIDAMQQVRASVSKSDLEQFEKWNESFGSTQLKPA